MDLQRTTVLDCIEMFYMKDRAVVVHDGRVCGFIEKDEIEEQEIEYPYQTAKSE